jgi:hypothetical protein
MAAPDEKIVQLGESGDYHQDMDPEIPLVR